VLLANIGFAPANPPFLGNLARFHSERRLRGVRRRTSPLIFETRPARGSKENRGEAFIGLKGLSCQKQKGA